MFFCTKPTRPPDVRIREPFRARRKCAMEAISKCAILAVINRITFGSSITTELSSFGALVPLILTSWFIYNDHSTEKTFKVYLVEMNGIIFHSEMISMRINRLPLLSISWTIATQAILCLAHTHLLNVPFKHADGASSRRHKSQLQCSSHVQVSNLSLAKLLSGHPSSGCVGIRPPFKSNVRVGDYIL